MRTIQLLARNSKQRTNGRVNELLMINAFQWLSTFFLVIGHPFSQKFIQMQSFNSFNPIEWKKFFGYKIQSLFWWYDGRDNCYVFRFGKYIADVCLYVQLINTLAVYVNTKVLPHYLCVFFSRPFLICIWLLLFCVHLFTLCLYCALLFSDLLHLVIGLQLDFKFSSQLTRYSLFFGATMNEWIEQKTKTKNTYTRAFKGNNTTIIRQNRMYFYRNRAMLRLLYVNC